MSRFKNNMFWNSGEMKIGILVSLVFVLMVVSSVVSMFCLFEIDGTVKNLINYGLQYNTAWTEPFSRLTMTVFGLFLFNIALTMYCLFFRGQSTLEASHDRTALDKEKQKQHDTSETFEDQKTRC
jgi:hypothetical protein